MRVEDPAVFRDAHELILSLVSQGAIEGLRIDHIDGLADPLAYLQRLQSVVGKRVFHVVVEKILGPDEALPAPWPVAGTTGYEFIRALAGLFVDRRREAEMTLSYAAFIGQGVDYSLMVADLKRRTLTRNLAGELAALAARAFEIAQQDMRARDLGIDGLRRAIIEFATALPVYRTYIDETGIQPVDRALVDGAAQTAKATRAVEDPSAVDFIVRLMALDFEAPEVRAEALAFARRLQQTTGPLMAKAVEDTVFYRYNRLIALNEVGGEPVQLHGSAAQFHATMQQRRASQPFGMSTTATHDTKRGEDARARLYAISEIPNQWLDAVKRWSHMNGRFRQQLPDGTAPEPNMEWFFYQSLVGAWPADLDPADRTGVHGLKIRVAGMMQKAAREAKLRTSWTQPADAYEGALSTFVDRVLDAETGQAFLADFIGFATPIFVCGALTALSQTLFKLMAPGLPDIYQGSELWDLSLVDPDNRRAVDFHHRADHLEVACAMSADTLLESWTSGAVKLRLIYEGLKLRRRLANWTDAGYVPLIAHGEYKDQVVGFARTHGEHVVVAVGVRLSFAMLKDATVPLIPPPRWGDTSIAFPDERRNGWFSDCITGDVVKFHSPIPVSELLRRFPVALLSSLPRQALRA
jgi:(1->4)-alpha-D-glucan 1-alpha-D-glucosylmutase